MSRARSQFQHTPLWAALATTIAELQATGELRVDTEVDYVIDHLCRELVALHGGSIAVHSKLGEGSEFSFLLPVNAITSNEEQSA